MLTVQEIIDHCDRQLKRERIGSIYYEEHEAVKMYLQKLLHYKDLEEQGRLVVLPFLPNEDVWDYSEFFDGTPYAEYYKLRDSFIGIGVSANGERTFEYDCFTIDPDQIGKTIFLSREEAERTLKGYLERK